MFHESCYRTFKAHFEQRNAAKMCPLCRAPIDETTNVTKILQKASNTDMNVGDAFALGKSVA